MSKVSVLLIDGVDVTKYVEENGFTIELNDIDDESSGRTMDGVMHRSVITFKVKIGVSFLPVPQNVAEGVLSAVRKPFFIVRYLDPMQGMRECEMYSGPKKIQLRRAGRYDENLWEGLQLSLIER